MVRAGDRRSRIPPCLSSFLSPCLSFPSHAMGISLIDRGSRLPVVGHGHVQYLAHQASFSHGWPTWRWQAGKELGAMGHCPPG